MRTLRHFRHLQKTCGTYATAKHIKSLGYPLEIALILLTYTKD
jgi:hypothetical protein